MAKSSKASLATLTTTESAVADSHTHEQPNSKLMQLPQELRDHIYGHLFQSTRLAYGVRYLPWNKHCRVVSASRGEGLAVLRACRRTHAEIGARWLGEVGFHFESSEAMLNKLANLPLHVRSQIRRVRLFGNQLSMCHWRGNIDHYCTANVLKLLPGLKLDRLTVLGVRDPEDSYETLDGLIRYSNGWKELYFISHSSAFLGFADIWSSRDHYDSPYRRRPQPSNWQMALDMRDGAASHTSVSVYRSSDTETACSILQPDKRTFFAQPEISTREKVEYGRTKDWFLMRPKEVKKEILVVAKRGEDVDYEENAGSSLVRMYDIREAYPGKTWKDIKSEQDAIRAELDPRRDEDELAPIVDSYTEVDEYSWPPLHFQR